MASNTVEIVKPSLPHMTSVERLSKFPVVEQTVDLASNLYGRVKDVNPIVNSVLSTAETTSNFFFLILESVLSSFF